MNLFLDQKYNYIVFEPVDHVKSQLKSIISTPWYDLNINLAGTVSDDNTFKLYPRFSIFGISVFGAVQRTAIITGKLEPEGEQTQILIELRPNHLVLFVFYLTFLGFIVKTYEALNAGSDEEWLFVAGLLFTLIFIRSLIYFSMGRLKNRFERTLLIHPEE